MDISGPYSPVPDHRADVSLSDQDLGRRFAASLHRAGKDLATTGNGEGRAAVLNAAPDHATTDEGSVHLTQYVPPGPPANDNRTPHQVCNLAFSHCGDYAVFRSQGNDSQYNRLMDACLDALDSCRETANRFNSRDPYEQLKWPHIIQFPHGGSVRFSPDRRIPPIYNRSGSPRMQ